MLECNIVEIIRSQTQTENRIPSRAPFAHSAPHIAPHIHEVAGRSSIHPHTIFLLCVNMVTMEKGSVTGLFQYSVTIFHGNDT